MTDHHDDYGYFDDHHEPLPFDDPPGHDDTPLFDHHDDDHAGPEDEPWVAPEPHDDDVAEVHDYAEIHHDDAPPDETGNDADTGHEPDVFPPALDVGELPEPVDGFPWIDTATLGTAELPDDHLDPVRPEELAAYAGQDIPPGADGWEALKDSDDPATAALARWWTQS
jgi:hypothetical protein